MALWIELHCDVLRGGRPPDDIDAGCASNRGDSPGVMVRNGQEKEGANGLRQQARARGWKMIPGTGWACPWCQEKNK